MPSTSWKLLVARAAARSNWWWPVRILHLLPLVLMWPVHAQSANQLELLQSLPEEQREALIEAALQRAGDGEGTSDEEEAATPRDRGQGRMNSEDDGAEDQVQRRSSSAPPTLRPGATLLINIDRPRRRDDSDRTQSDEEDIEPELNTNALRGRAELEERLLGGNPYRLDADGYLELPGMPRIALAGLSENQAAARLNSDSRLRELNVRVTLLPVRPDASDALEPFGYDMFESAEGSFAPPANMPVPSEYVLGPGDSLRVNLVGAENRGLKLEVDRNGEVALPQIGAVTVAGMRFDSAKELIEAQVAEQMIGVRAHVTMGTLRTIRIFVLGEAKQPGSYVVNGLSTITNALVASGGVSRVGSLRRIQLKREGVVISNLDLYDLLLRGDTQDDVRLQPGDVIYVPPIGPTVGISGGVRRPAIYELSGSDSARSDATTLVRLAGGFRPDADAAMSVVERINASRDRVVLNVDLSGEAASAFRLHSGDVVRVPAARPTLTAGVRIEGHVFRPGPVGFKPGMRLTDAIQSVDDLKPGADVHYVLIRREAEGDREVQVYAADLQAALSQPTGAANLQLEARDRITVFDSGAGRETALVPLLEELRRQATATDPARIVTIRGSVRTPGQYPLQQGMRVSDLLRAGGGLADSAYIGSAELTRYRVVDGERRDVELIPIDLASARNGATQADIELQPFDILLIKEMPQWGDSESIEVTGEVRFPGEYPIRRGETLDSVIARAGGFTELAFPDGAVFARRELREREQRLLDDLAERMRHDLAVFALQASRVASNSPASVPQADAAATGSALLAQLKSSRAVGRLVVDLDRVAGAQVPADERVYVLDGDELHIPRVTQEVTVIGEVQNATSHLYDPRLTREDYIRLSGGTTPHAAKSRVYVIRANGAISGANSTSWFSRVGQQDMSPGDSIVVPLDTERTLSLPLWTSVTTILYNSAISLAAVNSL